MYFFTFFRSNCIRILSILIAVSLCASCALWKKEGQSDDQQVSEAAVVSAREEASTIGIEILKKGGNAFDAMAATDFALAVCFPYAGNLGGGGFMVYRLSNGQTGSLDYREKAPIKAHRDMYLDENGEVQRDWSTEGALASGIPGTVKGILWAQKKFGLLSRQEVMQPAIELAKNGFTITQLQADQWNKYRDDFIRINGHSIPFTKKEQWKKGDKITLPILARTLEKISQEGDGAFYRGDIASSLVKELNDQGGIFTAQDLESYHVKERDPIQFQYKDLTITSMNLPSSGGICLHQIMKMIEDYDLPSLGFQSPEYIHLIAEAERRSYSDRAKWLGDADFVGVPIKELLNNNYLKQRMKDFNPKKASSSKVIKAGKPIEASDETTHYSIVDQMGNAVSVTTTINGAYGSKLYLDSLGFFMNNEMDDFSAKPGVANSHGLVGAEANAIEPGKRMLSSMTPTIVEQDGELSLVVGTPGGSTIITSVLQTILNVYEFDLSIQEAVDAPRFHHQWLPDMIQFDETGFSDSTLKHLTEMGHEVLVRNSKVVGNVNAILVNPSGKLDCGADKRGDNFGARAVFPR